MRIHRRAGRTALDVARKLVADFRPEPFAVNDALALAAVPRGVELVVVVNDAPADVADSVERQHHVVEVKEVGLVFLDQVHRAEAEILDVFRAGLRRLVAPHPHVVRILGPLLIARRRRVLLAVELLRVESFPPLPLPLLLGDKRIARLASIFVPRPGVRGVDAHAEAHAGVARSLCPSADDVLLRTHVDGVPRLVLRVEVVEVVMMVRHRENVARAHALVERDQLVGLPVLRLPQGCEVLEPEFFRIAVVFLVVLVLPVAFPVHVVSVPVARLGRALDAPVAEHAEARVLEPLRFRGHVLRERRDGDQRCRQRNDNLPHSDFLSRL